MNTTKNKYLNTLIIVFIIAIATLMLSSLMGGVNAVDISINNTNSTIQEAVNIISDGHDTSNTITLSNGTYLGSGNYNVNISSNTFNGRSLTIQGESKDGVIINAQGLGRIFIIRANNITLSNITFINGNFTGYGDGGAIANYGDGFSINGSIFNNNSAEYGGAIYNTGDNMSISGSSFNNNFADYGGAIYNWVANGFIVDNSVFVSNSAGIDGGVIENMYVYDFLVNNSVFVSNSAGGNGGVIDIYWSNNFAVVNSSFTLNNASHGGVIYSDSFNTSIIGSNIYDNYNGLNFTSATNATVNFNRFVNNTYTISGAGSGDNLSSNWWGQNSGIVAFINDGGAGGAIDYILDDYFVLLLNYSPNGNNAMVNSSFNKSKGNYVLSFYLALNTSNSTSMFNDTAYLLTSFNKTIVITNETGNTIYTPTANGFSSEALPLRNINRLIAIRALVDNEDLELSLLLDKPDYTDGLYVNSSWTGSNGDGSSWSSPFMNLSVALLAIVDNELNSNNCNFTIHIAGDDSTLLNNYTGDGVNVNLDLNSSYSNLTLSGEFGSPVFDGKSVSRIFNIGGSNITIANLIFINGYISNNGGAIYTTGNNISIINSIFVNNSANWGGGAIYNSGGSGFVVGNSSFSFNTASYGFSGGAIYNGGGSGFVVGNSSFSFNTARSGGAICILDSNDGNITYNRFVNNSASSDKAIYIYQGSNFNFSSNWFGSNNITGMIYNDTSNYILDDYFILLLNYYPNGNNTITNSSFNKSKGNYILSFYLALNTSNFTHIFNDTAYLLPEFNKTVIINNGTYNATYNTTANGFSSEALPLHYNNQLIAIRALADNEDLSLSLLLERPEYTNGLYVNSSWNDINCDGTSWDHPFINLKSALDAIVKYGLNSSNCNFTIHIAGDGSTLDYNYTGAGVNVNLDLNSSYSNLTLSGEFGSPVFDGKSVSCIFNIGGSNITIANLTFINGKVTGNGGAIYTTGNNISIINSIFVNNSANWGGGAIYNMGSDFVVDNSSFSSNTATGSSGGGAIYNYYGSGFVVGDSSFSFNTVSSGGGAIYNLDGSGFVVGDSSFSSNTASEGGAIYNSGGDGFSISGSNFADNSANYDGGAIENRGDNVSIMNSSFVNNVAGRYGGAICIWSNDDGNITYNRFVNNSASSDKAITISYSSNVNLSSNWFGSNNITGMIYNDSCSYVLEDYFVVFLKYLPSDSYLTSFDDDIDVFIDSYRLVYLFALNTSRGGGDIFNSTVSYLPDFDVLLVFSDGSFVNMSSHDAYYETAPFGLGFGDSVSINALVDNENLMLVLNVLDYSNGIYVNSSASSGGDGHNWSSAFTNLSDALNAIIVHKLNSSNCNFTIHIAGDNSTFAYNYTGDGVNVNLDLNSSYSNLTLFGEYGSPVFDGAGLFRIFNITGNNITLENIVFKNGASINNGGAIYNTGNNTKFMNSNFTNNSANWCGGAIVNYGSNFSLISSNFTNNIANAGGGAIYTLNNDNFSIIYSNFNNNCAEYGGAVFSWYSNFSINNSNFNNNFVSRYGGAIYNYGSDICIDDSNFNHNYVSVSASIDGSVYGGAVFSSIGDIIIDDSNFTHNYISISIPGSGYINGSVYGGGVYNFGGNMRVSGSNFDHNYISVPVSGSVNGSVFGGGVYSSGDNMLVSGSNFTNNSVEYTGEYTMYGGAIYNVGSNNKIMNSNFNNNSAFYGGAIYNNDDNLSINGSNFNNNYVSGSGGAIHNNNTYNLSISGSNFNNNSAKSFGGAIENFNASNLNIMSSNFNNNSAKTFYGGAIENDDGINISISGSNFTNNYANRGGGAIYTPHGVNISISGSIFTNNSVDDSGGAIYNDGSDNFSVSGSIFNNNYAKNFGGAILNYDSSNFTVTVTGSSFNNNSATYGGAIVVELSFNFSIMNSNFMSNIANIGSAIYITYKSIFLNNNITNNITIISNNFVNNTNTTIFASNVADILINHNRIYDMDKNHIAVNMTNDTIMGDVNWDLNYNWWGNNTPDTNYNLLNNYFVVNVIKNNLTNYLYTIRLNGSDEDYGFENKLPCFNGSLYLDYSNGSALVFDSKFNANNSHPLNINPAQIAIFTVDDWKSEFNNKITNITINNVSGAKYSTIVTLNASINAFDGNNTGIEIIFYINGEIIGSNTTNNLGNAYYHYKIPFAGNFTYMVSNNDSNHFPTNSSKIYGEFIKSNTNITINSNLNGSKYNNDIVLNATLLDEFGNPLSGVSVDFYINNVFIDSNITDSKGIAIYNYLVDFVGDYNLTSVFNGNDNYTGDIVSVFGDFVKADSNIIINSNINGSKYGDRVVFNATLLDEYGNPLSGVSVDFYINGVFVGSNVTDSNGIAIYNYVVGFVGNYNFTTVFNGNDNYNGDIVSVFGEFAKANSNIIINSNINGSKYNDRVVLNATLLDEYGNPLNNVSVDFYINGEFIDYGTTNTNGIAIINYTVSFVGDYNLTVIFDGNINGYYTYNVDSDSGFGEFIKAHGIINIDNIPKTVDINSKTTIKGNLTDKEGNLLNGKTNLKINVTIGKKSYIHNVEVIDGLWSLKISNPNIGTSNVKITLNDPNYEGNKEFNYTVSKIKTIITVYSPKITAAKKTNIVITLKDKYGKILKGKKLIIKSKYLKKPFKSTTNSKGQINIRIYASAIGKYTGTVEFTGDNIYTKSKKTITQIVTGLPDLTFTKIKRIKSSNYQLATYTVTIKNIGKGDSPKTQLYMQHWKYNGWKSKIIKVNIKAIKAGKSLTLTVKFLPDRGSHRTCKYQWFYINPLKNFKEISYKNNLKCLRP